MPRTHLIDQAYEIALREYNMEYKKSALQAREQEIKLANEFMTSMSKQAKRDEREAAREARKEEKKAAREARKEEKKAAKKLSRTNKSKSPIV